MGISIRIPVSKPGILQMPAVQVQGQWRQKDLWGLLASRPAEKNIEMPVLGLKEPLSGLKCHRVIEGNT